jgi:hypothetical protein
LLALHHRNHRSDLSAAQVYFVNPDETFSPVSYANHRFLRGNALEKLATGLHNCYVSERLADESA